LAPDTTANNINAGKSSIIISGISANDPDLKHVGMIPKETSESL
jgi:hypothetical protein